MNASRSTIVMTVSRCMVERCAGIVDRDHAGAAAPASNSALGEQLDAGRPGALAHADEHAAVADDEDVAALELRRAAELVAPRRARASANSGWWR